MFFSRYVHLTEEAVQSEDSLPFKIKAVNQFGVEQSHDLCDEDDNLSVHMSSGKPGTFTFTCLPANQVLSLSHVFRQTRYFHFHMSSGKPGTFTFTCLPANQVLSVSHVFRQTRYFHIHMSSGKPGTFTFTCLPANQVLSHSHVFRQTRYFHFYLHASELGTYTFTFHFHSRIFCFFLLMNFFL